MTRQRRGLMGLECPIIAIPAVMEQKGSSKYLIPDIISKVVSTTIRATEYEVLTVLAGLSKYAPWQAEPCNARRIMQRNATNLHDKR